MTAAPDADGVRWDGLRHSYVPDADWRARVSRRIVFHEEQDAELDPVTFEVIRNRLWMTNLAQGETITRISGSPILQSLDFNMCILTGDGEIVVNAPFVQFLASGSPLVARFVLEHFGDAPGIEPGDVYLCNDPWIGATHQNDVLLAAPVFVDGRLFAWVANAGHQIDLGGIVPGGWAQNAPDAFSDPVIFSPFKIVERGVLRPDLERMYRRQSRLPDLVALDLRSQLAGCEVGRREVVAMCEQFGAPTVKAAMHRLLDRSQRALSERLLRIPDGRWSELRYVEEALPGDRSTYRLQVNVTKRGDRLVVDNEGTDAQREGPIAFPYVTFVGAFIGVLAVTLLNDQGFALGGAERQIDFRPTPGLLNCADHPAAVGGGINTVSTHWSALMAIVGRMLACDPELKRELLSGTPEMPVLVMTGTTDDGRYVGAGFTTSGGFGSPARSFRDGTDSAGPTFNPLGRLLNIEAQERFFPVLHLFRRERTDGGGPGRWRGGTGVEYALVPYRARELTAITNVGGLGNSTMNGGGLFGGFPGPPIGHEVLHGTDVRETFAERRLPTDPVAVRATERVRLRAKSNGTPLAPGDVLVVTVPGSGGYGDPLDREPDRVADDVRRGYVSAAAAEAAYGVAVVADGSVDEAATAAARAAERARRQGWAPFDAATAGSEAPATSEPPRAVHEAVVARDEGNRRVLACARCDRVLAGYRDDYRAGLLVDESPLTILPLAPDPSFFVDDRMVFRRWCCPGCLALLTTQVARVGDPIVPELLLA